MRVSMYVVADSLGLRRAELPRIRPGLWAATFLVAGFAGVYLPLLHAFGQHTAPQISSAQTSSHASTATSAGAPTPSPASATASAAPANNQSCTPSTFGTPAKIDLTSQPAGLSAQTDPVTTYRIYATTAAGLRSQIQRCAPGSIGDSAAGTEYTAQTAYTLTWQYDTAFANDACTIANVKVGLHTAMIMPTWQATASATDGLSGRWQNFIRALSTHEQGHASLDGQYANKLLTDLNALPAMDCGAIDSAVSSMVKADVAAMNQSNDTYDASTNHGANQGAVLPNY